MRVIHEQLRRLGSACRTSPERSTPRAPREGDARLCAGLFPFRSHLLRESRLVSFPPLINMLKLGGSSPSTRGRREQGMESLAPFVVYKLGSFRSRSIWLFLFLSFLALSAHQEGPRLHVGFFRRGEVPCALSSALRMRPCPSKHGRAARFAPQPNVPLGVRARGAGSEHAGLAGWFGRLRGSASPALRHVNPTLGPNGWQAGMAGAGGQGEDWPSAPTATEERANPPRLQGTSGRGTCVPPGPANSPGRNRWREGQQQQQQPHVPP